MKSENKDSASQQQHDTGLIRETKDVSEEPGTPAQGAQSDVSITQPSRDAKKENSPATSDTPVKATKKPHHELLTEAEKKANHIASEQKRRQNIRVGFDSLVEIVPTLSDCHRSEAVILQKCKSLLLTLTRKHADEPGLTLSSSIFLYVN